MSLSPSLNAAYSIQESPKKASNLELGNFLRKILSHSRIVPVGILQTCLSFSDIAARSGPTSCRLRVVRGVVESRDERHGATMKLR